jgi:hypothetical protein
MFFAKPTTIQSRGVAKKQIFVDMERIQQLGTDDPGGSKKGSPAVVGEAWKALFKKEVLDDFFDNGFEVAKPVTSHGLQ